jgi:hypothetical protein
MLAVRTGSEHLVRRSEVPALCESILLHDSTRPPVVARHRTS